MPQYLFLMLLGALMSYTALGAELDPVRVGRYSALVPGPSPEQVDPFALAIHTEFPYTVQTVGGALEQVLARSGYRLARLDASCPSLPVLLAWPLPAVHRTLGPMRLDETLKTLAGPAHTLVIDPVHRLVSFELQQPYSGLVRAAMPSASASETGITSTPALLQAKPLELQALPVPAPSLVTTELLTTADGSPGRHRIGPIERGAELQTIAAELREAFKATTEQIMVGLFATNPKSFCYRNLHCLKRGAYLDPPAESELAAITEAAARRAVARHRAAWKRRTARRTEEAT